MMKKAMWILVILLIGTIITGCWSSKGKEQQPPPIYQPSSDEQTTQRAAEGGYGTTDDSYETGNLPGSPAGERTPDTYKQPTYEPPTTSGSGSTTAPAGNKMLGYRVQISALSTKEAALEEATKAANMLNVPGYIEHVGGLWKVRMGNSKTRQEAETLRDYARNKGYSDAWIVETEIIVK